MRRLYRKLRLITSQGSGRSERDERRLDPRTIGAIGLNVFFTLFIFTACLSAILDPASNGPDTYILRSIASYLHLHSIDTVLGSAASYRPSARPRIAPLGGYHVTNSEWSQVLPEAWARAFANGLFGVIIAVKPDNPQHLQKKQAECETHSSDDEAACAFVNAWLNSEKDKRVFVAFTKSDLSSAATIKKALEAQGYVVFMFLRPGHSTPWAEPGLVGEVFAQATHRFVVDTVNARGSEGVALESNLCALLLEGSPPVSKWQHLLRSATNNPIP